MSRPEGPLSGSVPLLCRYLFALGLSACALGCESAPPAPSDKTASLRKELDHTGQALQAAATTVLSAPRPCAEGVLSDLVGETASKPVLVSAEVLKALGQEAPANDALPFLAHKSLAEIAFRPKTDEEAILSLSKWRELKKAKPLMAVVKVSGYRPFSRKGDQFEPAFVEGTVTLFELGKAEPLCAETFTAQNSAEIAQRSSETLDAALESDIQVQARRSLGEAVHRLSRQLSL